MIKEQNFDKILSDTNLAFNKSPTKGIVFWYNLLLPNSEANNQINEAVWKTLEETFVKKKPDQVTIAKKIINNLRYIREQVLKNESARKKVEEIKDFLMQSIASEEVFNSLQKHVYNNYDNIKAELKNKKS